MPPRRCPYCQESFEPSKFRPDQRVCGRATCQRRRSADYHRAKIASDADYAQVVRDSQKKWRDTHRDYQRDYRAAHPEVVEQNRRQQAQRDCKQRLGNLVKNNLALDVKCSCSEAWLIGPAVADLVKNNLAHSKLFIFQPTLLLPPTAAGS